MVGEYLYSLRAQDERDRAVRLAGEAALPMAEDDVDALYRLCLSGAGTADRAMVVDAAGTVLTDSLSELSGTRLTLAEAAEALQTGEVRQSYHYGARGAGVLTAFRQGRQLVGVYAAPIRGGGALVLITASTGAYEALERIALWVVGALGAALLAGLVIALWTARTVTAPLSRFSAGIEGMTRGDYAARVEVKGRDEYRYLAESFNEMCERVQALDKARGQFVSNASHELRTPLSAMKILTQTLMYQDPPDPALTKDFLNDIDREIDRLNSIITDLLTLVSLDNDASIELRPLSLNNLLDETARRLQPIARERGIEMTMALREPLAVAGDSGRLERVFYNLIDNAIKYTGRGGHIHIECARRDRKACVRVSDTGIGIPPQDQQHIFDRFYRVDKARSRDTGGTGLGLSIVKQIVLMHGGQVSVSSEGPNKGSTFTVELPEWDGRGRGGRGDDAAAR